MLRRTILRALALFALTGPALAHGPQDIGTAPVLPTPATPAEVATYVKLLPTRPSLAVTFGADLAVAVLRETNGRQALALIGLYLKTVQRMPGLLGPDQRISNIHLRGDLIAFRADSPEGVFDYLWDSEEPGPPFWRLTATRSGKVTYSPHLAGSQVASFYLRDPHAATKLIHTDALRIARNLGSVLYVDGSVLILGGANAGENFAFRWLQNMWMDAGTIAGVVNHHAVADLNGDGLIEVIAGDTEPAHGCTRSWSALYTWNAAKTHVVATGIRAESAANLSGKCAESVPACFREESLTWDRSARPRPVVKIEGTHDTTGCPSAAPPDGKRAYQRRFAWDAKRAAFAPLAD